MATVEQVLDAMAHVRACTGDPLAGLSRAELAELSTAMPGGGIPEHLSAMLAGIHRRYPALFDPNTGSPITPGPPGRGGSPHQDGDSADTARAHEDALARQTNSSAQLDLLVINAVRGAHQTNDSGRATLDKLQHEIDDAVRRRTDLDTPAGARDFQRFLIGKLGEIESVLQKAGLDEASYRGLLTAWKSLYNADRDPGAAPAPAQPQTAAEQGVAPRDPGPRDSAAQLDSDEFEPDELAYLPIDPNPAPGLPAAAPPPTAPAVVPAAEPPPIPALAAPPGLGAGGLPASAPTSTGWPLADLLAGPDPPRHRHLADDADSSRDDEPDGGDEGARDDEAARDGEGENTAGSEASVADTTASAVAAGPTTVTLPDGEVVSVASPQLAAVIRAAVDGTPIAEAFRAQGITIPVAGSAVAHPLDPRQLSPGDIGMFTDRQALAVGNGKAILNGHLQPVATVTGPSFLGWEHPPKAGPLTPPGPPLQEIGPPQVGPPPQPASPGVPPPQPISPGASPPQPAPPHIETPAPTRPAAAGR